jgi:hypothetical protein
MQLSTLLTQFGLYKKDISDVSDDLFIQWINNIADYLYGKLADLTPESFMVDYNFTVSSSVQTLSLPVDFEGMIGKETGIFYLDSAGVVTNRTLPYSGVGRTTPGYYRVRSTLYFTPNPWGGSQSFVLRYSPSRTRFTATTDYFTLDTLVGGIEIVGDRFTEYLIKAIDVQYDQWDEDPGAEGLADIRYVRALDELLEKIKPTPAVYSISDPSNSY